jgi:hypothetical protein
VDIETIQNIFEERLDASVDGSSYQLAGDPKVTLLAETTDELMPMTRVREVDFDGACVTVVTEESTYFLPPETLFAVKLEDKGHQPEEHRAGFRR